MQDKAPILFNTVRTSRFRMNFFRFGSGPKTMVILPGISVQSVMGAADAVAQEYSIFSDDYTVYVFDRRENLPETYTVRDMAEDTAEAFRLLGLKDINLFGASQGGMISLVIAQEYPDLVDKLALGSSACRISDGQYKTIDGWVSYAGAGDAKGLYLSFAEKIYPEEIYRQYEDYFIVQADTVTERELQNFIIIAEGTRGFDVSDKMGQIQCPVLALEADDDRVLGEDAGALINDLMKDHPLFEHYVYSGFGHAAFDTAAPEYQERIFVFFNKNKK